MCSQYSNSQSSSQTPIVLLHGWGMNKMIWQPIIQDLPVDIAKRIINLDLPGFGENTDYSAGYELKDLANWLNSELADHEAVQLVGWSLGGLVAQQFAMMFPDKVQRLGLVASSPKFMAHEDWLGIKPDVLAMFAQQLVKDHKLTIERFLAIQAMGSKTARQDIKQLKDLVTSAPEPNLQALSKGLELLEKEDLRSQWSQLQCAVFALFGKLDSLVPIKAAYDMEKLANEEQVNMQITVMEKASHAPFISHPQDFINWFVKSLN